MTIAGSKTPQSASTNGHDFSLPPHGYLSQRSQSSQGNQTTQTKDWELLDKKSPGRPGAFSFFHFLEKINPSDLALSPWETWADNGRKVRVAKHHMPARHQWVPTPSRWVRRFVALQKAIPATPGSEW